VTSDIISGLDVSMVIRCLIQRGEINEHSARNHFIKKEYKEMIETSSPTEAKRFLADKYGLCYSSIEYIVYKSKS
jgi:hypothetical protein